MKIYDHLIQELSLRTKALPAKQIREVFILHINKGLSYRELGLKYNVPKQTIGWLFKEYKKALHEYEKKLQKEKDSGVTPIIHEINSVKETILKSQVQPISNKVENAKPTTDKPNTGDQHNKEILFDSINHTGKRKSQIKYWIMGALFLFVLALVIAAIIDKPKQ